VHENLANVFTSDRAQRTSEKYGAHIVSLLARKGSRPALNPTTPHPGGPEMTAVNPIEDP
jgi:hypothetical protein